MEHSTKRLRSNNEHTHKPDVNLAPLSSHVEIFSFPLNYPFQKTARCFTLFFISPVPNAVNFLRMTVGHVALFPVDTRRAQDAHLSIGRRGHMPLLHHQNDVFIIIYDVHYLQQGML